MRWYAAAAMWAASAPARSGRGTPWDQGGGKFRDVGRDVQDRKARDQRGAALRSVRIPVKEWSKTTWETRRQTLVDALRHQICVTC